MQIEFQVALINSLMHVKGYAAPETKAAVERAGLLIKAAEALGEAQEDPLLLFSVLHSVWIASRTAFNGDMMRNLGLQFLALAEKQGAAAPLMIGHRLVGTALLLTGDIATSREHLDCAIALYNPGEHRPLATRFGYDLRVVSLTYRSWALWLLGYPEAALVDADYTLKEARDIGHAVTLMIALSHIGLTHIFCGNYAAATAQFDELVALADKKSAIFKACGLMEKGCVLALTGEASLAAPMITSGIADWRSTGATSWIPSFLPYLAGACAELGQFGDAWRHIEEAIAAVEETQERWWEAEVNRVAGELALKSPERDATKAATYFERALEVARQQQAKSWELRAAMSLARLWRDQGKPQRARELLAPVYDWFTQGFDTLRSEGGEGAAGGVGLLSRGTFGVA